MTEAHDIGVTVQDAKYENNDLKILAVSKSPPSGQTFWLGFEAPNSLEPRGLFEKILISRNYKYYNRNVLKFNET